MEQKPMLVTSDHSMSFTPEALDLLLSYIISFIIQRQAVLEHCRRERGSYRTVLPDTTEETIQHEIERAQELVRNFTQVKEWLRCKYDWHFTQLAEVYRQTRISLSLARIEDMHSLMVAVDHLCQMLKSENPMFSRAKFLEFINEGK